MSFDGTTWLTDTVFEFLEDVKWTLHYGMQCVYGNSWNGEIRYDQGDWQSIAFTDTESRDKFTETMTLRKNGHYLEMYLDSRYGLGDRRYLHSNTASGAFSRIYDGFGKAYFHLVNSDNTYMHAGETAGYRGPLPLLLCRVRVGGNSNMLYLVYSLELGVRYFFGLSTHSQTFSVFHRA